MDTVKQFLKRGMVFSLFSAVCCSCSMPEVEEGPDSSGNHPGAEEVKMEVNLGFVGTEVTSRAIYDGVGTSGANNIGKVYVSLASFADGQYATYANSSVSATYTAADKEGSTSGELIWKADKDIYLNNNKAVVFGYAPLEGSDALSGAPSITDSDVTVAGLVIKASQTFDATDVKRNTCDQTDYLFSTNSSIRATPVQDTVSKADRQTTLYMHHALAKVSFKVRKGKGQPAIDDNDFVKKIKLFSTANDFPQGSGMTMSLVNGTLTGGTPTDTLFFLVETGKGKQLAVYDETDGFKNVAQQVYGLVAPLTKDEKVMAMELTIGPNDATTDKDRIYKTGNAQTKLKVNWERGKEYIYTVTISDQVLDVNLVQIVDFESGGEEEFPVD
ncbi:MULTISPECIES: fimbrillin family protein [Parabacteroides]|uniref:fimbrillin family protein n=4 Tax=Parabacteroides TaxID=375288 RepID=UPI00189AB486|nr:fimbrillin family protein [Parabacteroides goldsteinii]